ncbi:tyrosine-type recombinase/integrase family protein [Dactylosporangium aurantiacum]|uniref:Tyrosine-type recombinase/integrase family protein n=1 Tax=Dactylosporangium aurantiacum TaxID=35754 RepID=A0A9Q9IKJ6_9ACTN|nr:site-specific integrase [Dactylosporangium aurantiacum]MDG6107359.1 site-specific integrase [Dactylosporangium aurantiacum]UWZ54510.1 tyrosine-type recombinase/integrase family protein [Dactylosporangium aurantiacum]
MPARARANGEGSIYPHRNGFAAYVWVTKPDGKRTRKYVYGKTREDVHEKWVKLHAEAAKGPVATKTPTIASYAAYWLEEIVKPNLSPGTYVAYEVACRLYIVPGLGKKKLNLPARDAQTWINEVARTCQCCAQGRDERRPKGKRRCCAVRRCCKSTLSPSTLGHIRRTLRSMLGQAMVEETASRNVAKHLRLPVQRAARRKSWDTDDARKFLESARADGDPLYAAYVLVLVLGLRKGEMLGLTDDAIDWAGWDRRCKEHRETFCVDCVAEYDVTLQIDRQLQRIGTELLHRETKTPTSDAGLPLPPICAVAVRQRHLDTERDSAEAGPLWHGLSLLFTTRFGTPIEPRNFNRYWDRRCLAAGVPRITVRDARRTCGSLLADLDVHPRVAMQILRHAKFSITMEIYTQVSSKKTRDALKRLGASLG